MNLVFEISHTKIPNLYFIFTSITGRSQTFTTNNLDNSHRGRVKYEQLDSFYSGSSICSMLVERTGDA